MMGLHSNTVFKNSCLKVPLNPTNRLPSAKYERNSSASIKNSAMGIYSNKKTSIDSNDIDNIIQDTTNPLSFREFYKSIPDYEDVTHMSNREFYMTLESLKENKNKLLSKCGRPTVTNKYLEDGAQNKINKYISGGPNIPITRNYNNSASSGDRDYKFYERPDTIDKFKLPLRKSCAFSDVDSPLSTEANINNKKDKFKTTYDKKQSSIMCVKDDKDLKYSECVRNSAANKNIDDVLKKDITKIRRAPTPRYFEDNDVVKLNSAMSDSKDTEFILDDNYFKKSYSLPTSPVKRRLGDIDNKFLLSPKSLKYSDKHNENVATNHIRNRTKDPEDKLLKNTGEHKQFRANPVPIESRISLYDKIMEDQELRRSISKLQSTAELQAQMKPFTFTEREERQNNNLSRCYRFCRSNPQLAVTSPVESSENIKHFKAKPVPKNLFSNYIYEKMREDDFYRALNRRIRAEEMLKAASLPPSMAKRERVKNVFSMSPILQDVVNIQNGSSSSGSSGGSGKTKSKKGRRRSRGSSGKKDRLEREYEKLKKEFINGESPRKASSCNNEDLTKKIYGTISTSSSSNPMRAHSAIEIPSVNRSNLAAILRMEATKRKLEAEMMKILEEERFQSEVKWRDSVLRRKPAWNSIKYSQANELAMRLQTRKEEERLRREQFLHEMELMYGRVHQQPLMFERVYAPKRHDHHRHSRQSVRDKLLNAMPRSAMHSKESRLSTTNNSPMRSRKVSINETAETIGDDIEDMMYHSSDDEKDSKSSDIPESIGNGV